MSEYNLRPHHALCAAFFEGKGYSGEFTENMYAVINLLNSANPVVTLTVNTDVICDKCPNNINGVCMTDEKSRRYDINVLTLCDFGENRNIKWSDLSAAVGKEIIEKGKLPEVCGDCRWKTICASRSKKI